MTLGIIGALRFARYTPAYAQLIVPSKLSNAIIAVRQLFLSHDGTRSNPKMIFNGRDGTVTISGDAILGKEPEHVMIDNIPTCTDPAWCVLITDSAGTVISTGIDQISTAIGDLDNNTPPYTDYFAKKGNTQEIDPSVVDIHFADPDEIAEWTWYIKVRIGIEKGTENQIAWWAQLISRWTIETREWLVMKLPATANSTHSSDINFNPLLDGGTQSRIFWNRQDGSLSLRSAYHDPDNTANDMSAIIFRSNNTNILSRVGINLIGNGNYPTQNIGIAGDMGTISGVVLDVNGQTLLHNSLSVGADSSNPLFLANTQNGKVGIRTLTPQTPLDVHGGTSILGSLTIRPWTNPIGESVRPRVFPWETNLILSELQNETNTAWLVWYPDNEGCKGLSVTDDGTVISVDLPYNVCHGITPVWGKVVACESLPINAVYNSTPVIIHQLINGVWTGTSTGSTYNTIPSSSTCRFICKEGYDYDHNARLCTPRAQQDYCVIPPHAINRGETILNQHLIEWQRIAPTTPNYINDDILDPHMLYPQVKVWFNPRIEWGYVYVSAMQPDGKILIWWSFTTVDGQPRNQIARLHPDGTLDISFNAKIDNGDMLFDVVVLPNNDILIGWNFTSIWWKQTSRIAKLKPDGSHDESFNVIIDSYTYHPDKKVQDIDILPDGKILISWAFRVVNGQPRRSVARVHPDGTIDQSFGDPEVAWGVRNMIIQDDGRIVIAWWFTDIEWQGISRVARLYNDGTFDWSFHDLMLNNHINHIIQTPDKKLVVAGWFTEAGGQPYGHIARFHSDGTLDTSFSNPHVDDGLIWNVFATPDDKIIIGWNFSSIDGREKHRFARLNSDGSLDHQFGAKFVDDSYEIIRTMIPQLDGSLLLGGQFDSINGQSRGSLVKFDLGCYFTCADKYNRDGSACVLSKPLERIWYCTGLPTNALWNSVSKITQYEVDGIWSPSIWGTYNITPSTTNCRFICDTNYTRNNGNCVANTRDWLCDQDGWDKPPHSTWNSEWRYQQTRNGSERLPVGSTANHNTTASASDCRFKCDTNYTRDNNGNCVANTRRYNCPDMPIIGTKWNTVSGYTQTWNGFSRLPGVRETVYDTNASTTACYYICNEKSARSETLWRCMDDTEWCSNRDEENWICMDNNR